ncbi:MAG: cytochrome B [Bacteroidota bacterium]
MHATLLLLHSVVRYFVLIFLIVIIVRSFMNWQKKSAFTSTDDKMSLWLLILTHMQALVGFTLYFFTSSAVVFSSDTMKDKTARYWTVEHITMMLIAVVLITVARSTSKKLPEPAAKHRRLFVLNVIALLIILAAIATSGRGFFNIAGY